MIHRSRARLAPLTAFLCLILTVPGWAQRYGKGKLVLLTGETLEGEIREIEGGYEINLPGSKFGVPDPTVTVNYPKNEVKEVTFAGAAPQEEQMTTPPGYEDVEELLKDAAQAATALEQLDGRTDDERAVPDHHWMVARAARLAGDTWRAATAFQLFRHLGGNEAMAADLAKWLKEEGAKIHQQAQDPANAGNPAQTARLDALAIACDSELLMKAGADTSKSTFQQLESLEVDADLAKKDWHRAALQLAWYGTLAGNLEGASDVTEKILASRASKAVLWEAGALANRINADLEAVRLAEKEAGIPGEAEGVPPPEEGAPAVEEVPIPDDGSRWHDYFAVSGTEATPKPGEVSGVRQSDLLALSGGKAKAESYRYDLAGAEGERWEFTLNAQEAKQILSGKPFTKKSQAAGGKEGTDITIFRAK